MQDREWREKIEAEMESLKERMKKMEGIPCSVSLGEKTIELEIEWPEADIGGLHFNAQTTKSVFERKEDGNYYSKDILIHSARDTDNVTGRDLLSEYLDSAEVREAFFDAINSLKNTGVDMQLKNVRVFLPEKNQGVKKYNGVSWWYWLKLREGASSYFCIVHYNGSSYNYVASAVGGCAPAFCVA